MPKSTKDIKTLPPIHALVYGDPKTGKSTFAATFPTPAYIFLFEPDLSPYAGKDFEYDDFNPNDPADYDKVIQRLDELQSECKYKTVIVDSLTEFAVLLENRILHVNRRDFNPALKLAYSDKSHGMRIQDWGVFKTAIENFVRNLNALPCHTVSVAHEVVKQTGDASVIKGCLSIPGNFGETGAKLFNTVLRMRAERNQYVAQTMPDRLFTAGVWGASLPNPWPNPSFAELEKAFRTWQARK